MDDSTNDGEQQATARPGPRRPATLQGIGGDAESDGVDETPADARAEERVRSLADLAAESHLTVSGIGPAPAPLPEPSREPAPAPDPAPPTETSKPAPLTLGAAKKATHNFDSIRRPTAGNMERVESASARRERRKKSAHRTKRRQKAPAEAVRPRGGVIEERGPAVKDRLRRLSDGEFLGSSPVADTANAGPTAPPPKAAPTPEAAFASAEKLDTEGAPSDERAGLPDVGPRRERRDEKTRRHVYGEREVA